MFLCHWTYGADVFLVGFFRKREYNITDNNLEGKYKDWQKKLHPDLVHSKSEVSVHLTFIEYPYLMLASLNHFWMDYIYYLEREGLCCGAVSTCDRCIPHTQQTFIKGIVLGEFVQQCLKFQQCVIMKHVCLDSSCFDVFWSCLVITTMCTWKEIRSNK